VSGAPATITDVPKFPANAAIEIHRAELLWSHAGRSAQLKA
jgi:hypothetical protein